ALDARHGHETVNSPGAWICALIVRGKAVPRPKSRRYWAGRPIVLGMAQGTETCGGTAMHRVTLGALAASLAACLASGLAAPALAQSAAPAPALGAEQAIQLF